MTDRDSSFSKRRKRIRRCHGDEDSYIDEESSCCFKTHDAPAGNAVHASPPPSILASFQRCNFNLKWRRLYVLLVILLLDTSMTHIFGYPQSQGPPPPPSNLSSSTTTTTTTTANSQIGNNNSQSKQSTSQQQQPEAKSSLVQVYEHEHYSKATNSWHGGSESPPDPTSSSSSSHVHRWTSSSTNHGTNVKILPPPSELSAPKGYKYTGEWKIDVSSSTKDELGWEYYVSKGTGRRRRRWLRTVVEVMKDKDAIKEKAKEKEEEMKQVQLQQTPLSKRYPSTMSRPAFVGMSTRSTIMKSKKLMKIMTDSFNFKGFGLTANKSLLSKTTGLGWRIPLSANFDFWESRPFLPLCNCSFGLFYPIRVSCLINASLPVVLFQTAICVLLDWVAWIATMLYTILWQTIVVDLVGKVLLLNSIRAMGNLLALGPDLKENDSKNEDFDRDKSDESRQGDDEEESESGYKGDTNTQPSFSFLQRKYPPIPSGRSVTYSTSIIDRFGVNFGIHLSKARGLEIRCNWYHAYIPTVGYLNTKLDNIKHILTKKSKPSSKKMKNDMLAKLFGARTASLGVVWGGSTCLSESIHMQPPMYCSSVFALNGLYPAQTMRRLREIQTERRTRAKVGKKLDSRLKKRSESKLDGEYEEIIEVKVGAS